MRWNFQAAFIVELIWSKHFKGIILRMGQEMTSSFLKNSVDLKIFVLKFLFLKKIIITGTSLMNAPV